MPRLFTRKPLHRVAFKLPLQRTLSQRKGIAESLPARQMLKLRATQSIVLSLILNGIAVITCVTALLVFLRLRRERNAAEEDVAIGQEIEESILEEIAGAGSAH